jgi:hypothetical protein
METEATSVAPERPTHCKTCQCPLTESGAHDLHGLTPERYEVAKQEMLALHEALAQGNLAMHVEGLTVEIVSIDECERDAQGREVLDKHGDPIPKVIKRGRITRVDTKTGKVTVQYEDGTESA